MTNEEIKQQQEDDMEKKILEAAGKVFILKGRLGASMQDIADEAGINRTLLHYYFRSKDKLFENVFNRLLNRFFPALTEVFLSDLPFLEKLERFIETYTGVIRENPFLPIFVFQEIQLNPERITGMMQQVGLKPEPALKGIRAELARLGIGDTDPRHLFADMMGMVLFPYIGRPIFQAIAFRGDQEAYEEFLLQREGHITQFMGMALSNGKTNANNTES